MDELFASGHAVDLVLAFAVLEGAVLVAWRYRTGRGLAAAEVLSLLVPGVWLLLALRCSVTGAWWGWIAVCLLGALGAHLVDLGRRWSAAARQTIPPTQPRGR